MNLNAEEDSLLRVIKLRVHPRFTSEGNFAGLVVAGDEHNIF